jgi:hypothetical protein
MRIGTWNMEGRWDERHARLIAEQDCDVWLLTEVNDRMVLDEYEERRTNAFMSSRRRWAGVFSRIGLEEMPDPHPATAAAVVDGVTFWSSILPWRGSGELPPWEGDTHAERTARTLDALLDQPPSADLVWGGDSNHAMTGPEHAGSKGGRAAIADALSRLELTVHTCDLPHRIPELLSIDHIALPIGSAIPAVSRAVAMAEGARLSDHDLYVADLRVDVQGYGVSQS